MGDTFRQGPRRVLDVRYGKVARQDLSFDLDSIITGAANWVAADILTPTPDGVNNVFSLTDVPVEDKETIFYNGVALERGSGNDYLISGQTITLSFVPEVGAKLTAAYYKS